MSEPSNAGFTQMSAVWPDVNEVPVFFANAFVTQMGAMSPTGAPDPLILTIGQVTPPLVLGTPEEQQAMMAAMGAIAVRTLGRYTLTRPRLQELIALLQRTDEQLAAAEQNPAAPEDGEQP